MYLPINSVYSQTICGSDYYCVPLVLEMYCSRSVLSERKKRKNTPKKMNKIHALTPLDTAPAFLGTNYLESMGDDVCSSYENTKTGLIENGLWVDRRIIYAQKPKQ